MQVMSQNMVIKALLRKQMLEGSTDHRLRRTTNTELSSIFHGNWVCAKCLKTGSVRSFASRSCNLSIKQSSTLKWWRALSIANKLTIQNVLEVSEATVAEMDKTAAGIKSKGYKITALSLANKKKGRAQQRALRAQAYAAAGFPTMSAAKARARSLVALDMGVPRISDTNKPLVVPQKRKQESSIRSYKTSSDSAAAPPLPKRRSRRIQPLDKSNGKGGNPNRLTRAECGSVT